jgi:hypothetical protein
MAPAPARRPQPDPPATTAAASARGTQRALARVAATWVLLFALASRATAAPCRMQEGAQHDWCGLPWQLSNFQVCLDSQYCTAPTPPTILAPRLIFLGTQPRSQGCARRCIAPRVSSICSGPKAPLLSLLATQKHSPLLSPPLAPLLLPGMRGAAHCYRPPTQGHFACSSSVILGRPKSYAELSQLVKAYSRVKASGVGHRCGQGRGAPQQFPLPQSGRRRLGARTGHGACTGQVSTWAFASRGTARPLRELAEGGQRQPSCCSCVVLPQPLSGVGCLGPRPAWGKEKYRGGRSWTRGHWLERMLVTAFRLDAARGWF